MTISTKVAKTYDGNRRSKTTNILKIDMITIIEYSVEGKMKEHKKTGTKDIARKKERKIIFFTK